MGFRTTGMQAAKTFAQQLSPNDANHVRFNGNWRAHPSNADKDQVRQGKSGSKGVVVGIKRAYEQLHTDIAKEFHSRGMNRDEASQCAKHLILSEAGDNFATHNNEMHARKAMTSAQYLAILSGAKQVVKQQMKSGKAATAQLSLAHDAVHLGVPMSNMATEPQELKSMQNDSNNPKDHGGMSDDDSYTASYSSHSEIYDSVDDDWDAASYSSHDQLYGPGDLGGDAAAWKAEMLKLSQERAAYESGVMSGGPSSIALMQPRSAQFDENEASDGEIEELDNDPNDSEPEMPGQRPNDEVAAMPELGRRKGLSDEDVAKLRMEQMDHYNKNMPAGSSGIGLMQSSTELIDAEADDDSEDDLYLNDPNTDEPQMPNGGVAPSNVAANQRPYRERATDLSGAMGLYKASLALHQEHHGELPDWVNAALADEIPDYDWSARNGPNDSSKPKEPSLMPKPTADVAGKTLEIAMRGTPGANPSDDEESSSRSSGIFEPYSDASEPAAPGPNPTGDNDANKAGQTSTIGGQPVDLNEDKDDD